MWDLFVILLSLGLLMYTAYRGFSVILMAPLCALLAVFLINPANVLPFYSGVFMPKMVNFIKDYFLVFLLGAIFGKVVEMSGIAESIARTIVNWIGAKKAILTVVLLGAILTYSGVSLFVAVFAIYPFANQLFQQANIPKRLIPGTIALGAFTFTMDALPGTPQIQNVIPTTFFGTNIYAAPFLGVIGAIFVLGMGLLYLESRRKAAARAGEGYAGFAAEDKVTPATADVEASTPTHGSALRQCMAFVPLILVAVMNRYLSTAIKEWYPNGFDFNAIGLANYSVDVAKTGAIWAVGLALIVGIIAAILFDYQRVVTNFKEGVNASIGGSLLAVMNTASEYGFGAIIAALPGFALISHALGTTFTNPLVNGAVTTTVLAGITGSASGGMSIALSAMAETYNAAIVAAGIPPEVMHRVVAMASGGMDTLPHNGAVITLLAVTGLTHKQSYKDIFAVTVIKTLAVFVVIAAFTWFGIV
ncbi:D-beta-hydroxybutyrate permease [Acinetobacter sp. neg1]|jgi:H+/gluconate symporter-like permease|uniref:GntP family permease n=1 Tax=Acinetobacter TaxID=469 RepID=UPI0005442545|nr:MULTISPECIES: GntP family permease [Acinetobacter]KHF77359.1 D-beta-hydroxybutyrate permease [Acinetobacter sp. neg1]KYQ84538.1 transporter [Acinetobacter sp. NRRL B-65365]MBJ8483853.1 GntP family permease [Acinetobacter vivianii]OEC91777.1 transporter [Acinetobacter sp. YK3]